MNPGLFRLNRTLTRDPAIDAWFHHHSGKLHSIARHWFEAMRNCGDEVREVMHDGCPTACLGDAAFAYVAVFTSHVNIGFFRGATLRDPAHLLLGTGKLMRHVKLKAGTFDHPRELAALISASYADIKAQVEHG